MNGGYCLINAAGVDATSDAGVKVDGLYAKLRACGDLNKPMFFSNIISGENGTFTPLLGAVVYTADAVSVDCGVVKFTVASDDTVTITN